jgi:hypothetical protein
MNAEETNCLSWPLKLNDGREVGELASSSDESQSPRDLPGLDVATLEVLIDPGQTL